MTSVAAVVPAFRPGEGLLPLVRGLLEQTPYVVVVDDSGGDPCGDPRGDLLDACRGAGAVVARHEVNAGIAAALATGIERVRERWPAVEAVLTVDQDSQLAPDHLERLLAAWAQASGAGLRVGLVGPQDVEGLPTRAAGRSRGVLLGREPVQSGLLVPLEVLDEVGGLDLGLFIDGVDTDLYLKILDARRVVIVAPGVRVGHRLGTRRTVRVGRRSLELTVSAPFRTYYLVRNRLRLVARHGRRHPAWAEGQLLGLARHLGLMLAVAPERRRRLEAMTAGVRDAVRGRSGRRPGA